VLVLVLVLETRESIQFNRLLKSRNPVFGPELSTASE
jgi:hypothetical protein